MVGEAIRQEEHIELIASENYTSPRVMEAQGSVLTTSMLRVIRASVITVVASMWISLSSWRLIAPSSCSMPGMRMFSPTPVPGQCRCFYGLCQPGILFLA